MKTSPRLQLAFLGTLALCLIAQAGCRSVSKGTLSVACDALPPCQLACDSLDDYGSGCEAMPCGCDDGCSLCCDDYSADACDGLPGMASRQLVRGRRIEILDDFASTLGFANKLALWDRRADSHQISPKTEQEVLAYLRRNQLDSVLVRSNQYDPLGEWDRLVANKRMAAPWKYTFGTYEWLRYTLIPGRLVGGDWYNPFTDSVHLYSDIPSIGLAKAAYAKDIHHQSLPGTYAASQSAPILGLWHESVANDEVLNYLRKNGRKQQLDEANRILIPDFGGAMGAQVLGFLPYGSVYGRAAGALTGHAYRGLTKPDTVRQATTNLSPTLR